jgi:hypothetical protein
MTAASGYHLHPEAARDIAEIWEDIASDNPAGVQWSRNGSARLVPVLRR